jgi:hypothetical protein
MDQTPSELVQTAIDALLLAVKKSAEDLNAFHAAVTAVRPHTTPPFPRATVIIAERVIDDLRRVEQDLRSVLVDFGVSHEPPGSQP